VIGALVLAFVILVVLPVTFLVLAAILTAVMGWILKDNGEAAHEGSELVDLNY
jgi:phosphotransferase system  glucose/maltose/N-acetylglucosamine-specific IIC component